MFLLFLYHSFFALQVSHTLPADIHESYKHVILGVMKLSNFVTIARKMVTGRPANTADYTSSKTVLRRKGKRIIIPSSDVNKIYRSQRQRLVRVEYTGPKKIHCLGCKEPFLYTADGQGRYPEYHSNACKQKAYRERKKGG
jgi:hypothetical protein